MPNRTLHFLLRPDLLILSEILSIFMRYYFFSGFVCKVLNYLCVRHLIDHILHYRVGCVCMMLFPCACATYIWVHMLSTSFSCSLPASFIKSSITSMRVILKKEHIHAKLSSAIQFKGLFHQGRTNIQKNNKLGTQ